MSKKIYISITHTVLWLIVITTIGLVQYLIYLLVVLLCNGVKFPWYNFIQNGITVISLTLVASTVLDIFFQKKFTSDLFKTYMIHHFKIFEGWFFQFYPWIIIILIGVLTTLHAINPQNLKLKVIEVTECISIVLSYGYAGYYKYHSFLLEIMKGDFKYD